MAGEHYCSGDGSGGCFWELPSDIYTPAADAPFEPGSVIIVCPKCGMKHHYNAPIREE